MKQKLTDEQKKEMIGECISLLKKANKSLDKAYIHHTIASKRAAANDETRNN